MATNTYVAIETKTITSTVQAVTFTSIPQTYTDLVLVGRPKCDGTRDLQIRVGNGTLDTGSNYSATAGWASTTTTGTNRNSGATYMYSNYYAGATATAGENVRVYQFANYANTNIFKSVLQRSATASLGTDMLVGTWRSTSAINTISMFPLSGDIVAGSTFTLYGIVNSNAGAPKAFGGTITQDATYTYHVFGASGTFVPQQSLTADVLVVAGGGGGGSGQAGNHYGGGGGAGGLRSFASQSLTATNYTVTVGAGGAGGAGGATNNGANGGASSFTGLTATVGGGGGGSNANNGLAGGSGGGGGGDGSGTTRTGGAGTSGEGNAGGNKVSAYHTGGGGGAGAVGQNGSSDNSGGGAGGIGVTSSLINAIGAATGVGEFSSGNYYFAGGGGGTPGGTVANGRSFGGLGGGGNGSTGAATGIPFMPGTPSTGGGGGGGDASSTSNGANAGNGGSGAVIIRYLTA